MLQIWALASFTAWLWGLCWSSSLSAPSVYYLIPFLFPHVPPLPLSFCLQPSRRPSLQPTFSLDCVSAPSAHHHCHQTQCFASQLSLCTGNPHPSSPCTTSHLPSPPFYSSCLKFSHHSSPSSQPSFQISSYYNSSLSPQKAELNPDSKPYPSLSLQAQANVYSAPHTASDSLSNGSCFHKTNLLTNSHMLCSSEPKCIDHPRHFSPLLSQSSPDLNSLPCGMSSVCPHALQNVQPKPISNLKSLLFPRFHPDCQTNPSTPLQPNSASQAQHPAVQSCGRPPLAPAAWLTLPHTERVPSAFSLSSTNPHPSSGKSIPSSRPLKAGGVLKHFLITRPNLHSVSVSKKVATVQSSICGGFDKYPEGFEENPQSLKVLIF